MNIAHRNCAFIALLAAAFCCGCQGLQGVRYHEGDLSKAIGDGIPAGDAGFEVGFAEGEGDGAMAAPHPRFHPVPTRPVFESDGIVGTAAVAPPVAAPLPDPVVAPVRSSRTTSTNRTPSVLASAPLKTSRLAGAELNETSDESNDEAVAPSSRRTAEVTLAEEVDDPTPTAPDKVTTVSHDETATFTPVKVEAPTTNDMWRPRVGNP